MKNFFVAIVAVGLSAGMAFADDTNPKGAGGAAVSSTAQAANDSGTNLGQLKKSLGVKGIGQAVKAINQGSNQ